MSTEDQMQGIVEMINTIVAVKGDRYADDVRTLFHLSQLLEVMIMMDSPTPLIEFVAIILKFFGESACKHNNYNVDEMIKDAESLRLRKHEIEKAMKHESPRS